MGGFIYEPSGERSGDGRTSGASTATRAGRRERGDFGILEKPGKALRDSVQRLRPGETLRFTTRENQIWGIGDIAVEPPGALQVRRLALRRCEPVLASGSSFVEYAFTVPADARPGASIRVTAAGRVQTRRNPGWAFSFVVEVEE